MISIADGEDRARRRSPDTAAPAASVESKAASSVRTRSGRRSTRSVTSVAMPSVPSEPTNAPSRSGPGDRARADSRTASPSGSTTTTASHVVDREAVLQAVRAARVLRDVAADRADLLARRIGRVVEAVRDHRLGHLEVRHARLDDDRAGRRGRRRGCGSSARGEMTTPVRDRERAAGEPRAGAARDERDAVRVACAHDCLHLLGRLRQTRRARESTRCPVSPSHS